MLTFSVSNSYRLQISFQQIPFQHVLRHKWNLPIHKLLAISDEKLSYIDINYRLFGAPQTWPTTLQFDFRRFHQFMHTKPQQSNNTHTHHIHYIYSTTSNNYTDKRETCSLHEKWNESQNRWQLSGWQRQVCNEIKLFKICTATATAIATTATAAVAVVQCSLLSVVVTVDSNNNNSSG